ncbi:hypothetical protein WAF17_19180 [Bernardetia sp. ABR2-2B]|uniref:hypothetical protein n=1 Tax=Bernardetia sp. ABR2-2B TaxID=3127472 RepID=UPI0030CDDDAC
MRKFLTRAKKIALSNYGRDSIWLVELNGQVIAKLSDANFEDMLWYSYKITFLNKKNIISSNPQSWWEDDFKFKNEYLSEYAENPFSNDMLVDGRVKMRALYVKPKNKLETFIGYIIYWYSILKNQV